MPPMNPQARPRPDNACPCPFIQACMRGDPRAAKSALPRFDPCALDSLGRGALSACAVSGSLECMALAEKKCRPCDKDFSGKTALHWACISGNAACARRLLQLGAKQGPDSAGNTPAMLACLAGHACCAAELAATADLFPVNARGQCCFQICLDKGSQACLAALLAARGLPELARRRLAGRIARPASDAEIFLAGWLRARDERSGLGYACPCPAPCAPAARAAL